MKKPPGRPQGSANKPKPAAAVANWCSHIDFERVPESYRAILVEIILEMTNDYAAVCEYLSIYFFVGCLMLGFDFSFVSLLNTSLSEKHLHCTWPMDTRVARILKIA